MPIGKNRGAASKKLGKYQGAWKKGRNTDPRIAIEDGTYLCQLREPKLTTTRKTNDPMVKFPLVVLCDHEGGTDFQGKQSTKMVVLAENEYSTMEQQMGLLGEVMRGLGFDPDDIDSLEDDLEPYLKHMGESDHYALIELEMNTKGTWQNLEIIEAYDRPEIEDILEELGVDAKKVMNSKNKEAEVEDDADAAKKTGGRRSFKKQEEETEDEDAERYDDEVEAAGDDSEDEEVRAPRGKRK